MKTATTYDALGINYCKVEDFIYENGMIKGANCMDKLSGKPLTIHAKKVVSASGPWVDKLRKEDGSLSGKRLHLTKGVHIVFPYKKFPLKHTTYFDGPDGRMIFAIPRGRVTYVGTTDTSYKSRLDRVVATRGDAEYLLNAVQHGFPSIQLAKDDIISNWAGLRPLIHEDGKSPSELSRKDEIFVSDQGLISIAGGKLTGYRKMAQRIVDLVTKQLGAEQDRDFPKCKTKDIFLTPKYFADFETVKAFINSLTSDLKQVGLENYHAWYLTTNYGRQASTILDKMETFKSENPEVNLARAEAWYGLHYEMINSAEDFFVRRTGRLYFDIQSIQSIRAAVMNDFKQYLKWNEARMAEENKQLDELIYDATHYYEKELN